MRQDKIELYEFQFAYSVLQRMLNDTAIASRSFVPLLEAQRELAVRIANLVVR